MNIWDRYCGIYGIIGESVDMSSIDDEYYGAIESGDIVLQDKLIKQAARIAGYNVDMVLYHGSNDDSIRRFEVRNGYSYGSGIYLTPEKDRAIKYGRYVYRVYAKWSNPVLATFKSPDRYRNNIIFDKLEGITNEDKNRSARNMGYDSVVYFYSRLGDGDPVEVVVFDSDQVAFADRVIRDKNGIIIAPSDRFK